MIGERFRRGKLQKAREGHFIGGKAPYGYRYIPKRDGVPGHLVRVDRGRVYYEPKERGAEGNIKERIERWRCGRGEREARAEHLCPFYIRTSYWRKLLTEAKKCFVEVPAVPAKSPVTSFPIDVEAVVCSYDPNTKVRLHCGEVGVKADAYIGRRKRIIGTPD